LAEANANTFFGMDSGEGEAGVPEIGGDM